VPHARAQHSRLGGGSRLSRDLDRSDLAALGCVPVTRELEQLGGLTLQASFAAMIET
jgi:hypothetical protein